MALGEGSGDSRGAVESEERRRYVLGPVDRLLYRTRYFTDSGVIGSKAFVSRCGRLFEGHFACRHEDGVGLNVSL